MSGQKGPQESKPSIIYNMINIFPSHYIKAKMVRGAWEAAEKAYEKVSHVSLFPL